MTLVVRLLTAVVFVELVCAAIFLGSRAWRVAPLLPNEQLADPLIIPDLQRFADEAQRGVHGAWTNLGNGLLGKGFYAHAELAFREALHHDQPSFPAQFGLAFSLDRMGRLAESSKEYKQVLAMPSDSFTHTIALYALGRNALRGGDEAEAVSFFRSNPRFTAAVYQTAKMLVRSGRPAEALPIVDGVLALIPHALEFHFLRFRALAALGRERDAFTAASMVERSADRVSLNFNTDFLRPLEQVTKQLNKLVNVLKIVELDEDTSVQRAIALVKVKADAGQRSSILEVVQLFRAKVVDVALDAVTIEVTGTDDKIEALLKLLEPYGIKELVKSGVIAVSRGGRSITDRTLRPVDRTA